MYFLFFFIEFVVVVFRAGVTRAVKWYKSYLLC